MYLAVLSSLAELVFWVAWGRTDGCHHLQADLESWESGPSTRRGWPILLQAGPQSARCHHKELYYHQK